MTEYNENEPQEVTLDSLFADEQVNGEQVNQAIRDSGAPAGTYTSNPDEFPLQVYPEYRDEKDVEGQVTGKRKGVTFRGLFSGTFAGKVERARIRFSISPDYRQKKVYVDDQWTGEYLEKPDNQSKLYAQAVKVHEAKVRELPKTFLALVEWMQQNPISVRTMIGRDGEPVVLNVVAARRR